MKYKINGYKLQKIIKTYIENGNKINVQYLDNSFKEFNCNDKDLIQKEMHKQADRYSVNPIYLKRIFLLLLACSFYMAMFNSIVSGIASIYYQFISTDSFDFYVLLKPFIKFTIGFIGVKKIKEPIMITSKKAEDITKYRYYLGLEKKYQNSNYLGYIKLVNKINDIDKMNINDLYQLKQEIDESDKKLVLKYNVNKNNNKVK